MSEHPLEKVFGVPADADPLTLLGLTPQRCEVGHIEIAMRQRLKMIEQAGSLSSNEAERAREAVRTAAQQLKDPWQRKTILAERQARQEQRRADGARSFESGGHAGGDSESDSGSGSGGGQASRTRGGRDAAPVRPSALSSHDKTGSGRRQFEDESPTPRDSMVPSKDERLDASPPTGRSERGGRRTTGRAGAPRRSEAKSRRPSITLTAFDRQVLATLVAAGGWNHEARARLTGLASMYGVTVSGLIKVVRGLSDYARSGGARLEISQITGGRQRMDPPETALPPPLPSPSSGVPDWLDRLTPDLSAPSPRQTIMLSAVFGLLTIVLGVILALIVTPGDQRGAQQAGETPTVTARPDVRRYTVNPADQGDEGQDEGDAAPVRRPASFDEPPTFRREDRPIGATTLAGAASDWPDDIRRVGRRLAVADAPSDAVFREWEQIVEEIGTAWALLAPTQKQAIQESIESLFYDASGTSSTIERLIEPLALRPDRDAEPAYVWRGAWSTGMLARLAEHRVLSPAVVDRADRTLLETVGDAPTIEDDPFIDHARAWLDAYARAQLIDRTRHDDAVFDHWELWLAAQKALGTGLGYDRALMRVVSQIMREPPALDTDDRRLRVVGRLLGSVNFRDSRATHQAVEQLFTDDDAVSEMNLWMLTSLLATTDAAPWFEQRYIVAAGGDFAERRRRWDDIDRAWSAYLPDAHGEGRHERIVVDQAGLTRWREMFEDLRGRAAPAAEDELMLRFVALVRLSEAAEMLRGEAPTEAISAVEAIGRLVDDGPPDDGPDVPPGRVTRSDGQWAGSMREAGDDGDRQIELIDSLVDDGGGDLGPQDAEVLVGQIYRPRTREHRNAAHRVLTGQFKHGPTVAQAMVDQFTTRTRRAPLAETIEVLTGHELPGIDAAAWVVEARLALLDHALSLRDDEQGRTIDRLAELLAESLREQVSIQQGRPSAGVEDEAPAHTAAILTTIWRNAARELDRSGVERAIPDELSALERRHDVRLQLARGPIERCVAQRLSTLELMAFITAGSDTRLGSQVEELLGESGRQRMGADHILRQAVEIELAIAQLWAMRLTHSEEIERGDSWLDV